MDPVDREAIYQELWRVRVSFRRLVQEASPDDLARASSGTRWTNQQLLFHMLFGYLITRALIVLAGMSARLPASASRVFAGLLNAATGPFDGQAFFQFAADGFLLLCPLSPRPRCWPGGRCWLTIPGLA